MNVRLKFVNGGHKKMSDMTMEEKIDAIYRTVVKGAPASDELMAAAEQVVKVRFDSSKEWEDLDNSICELANALERKKV